MSITLSEAIHITDENAKSFRERARLAHRNSPDVDKLQTQYYIECAEEQEQIKEWLKELQILRWRNRTDAE